jgi:hypothetical protein
MIFTYLNDCFAKASRHSDLACNSPNGFWKEWAMRRYFIAAAMMLSTSAAANAQSSCIEVVNIAGNHGFYNGCNTAVLIGYSSDAIGYGVIGPINPERKEVTATPRRYNISWRACYYGDWAKNSCRLR